MPARAFVLHAAFYVYSWLWLWPWDLIVCRAHEAVCTAAGAAEQVRHNDEKASVGKQIAVMPRVGGREAEDVVNYDERSRPRPHDIAAQVVMQVNDGASPLHALQRSDAPPLPSRVANRVHLQRGSRRAVEIFSFPIQFTRSNQCR